jgi:hypothetical protein
MAYSDEPSSNRATKRTRSPSGCTSCYEGHFLGDDSANQTAHPFGGEAKWHALLHESLRGVDSDAKPALGRQCRLTMKLQRGVRALMSSKLSELLAPWPASRRTHHFDDLLLDHPAHCDQCVESTAICERYALSRDYFLS